MDNHRNSGKEKSNEHAAHFEVCTLEPFLPKLLQKKPEPVFYKSYTVIWILIGSGKIQIDLEYFDVEHDTIYYIKPGQAAALHIDEPATGFVMSFTREFVDLYEKNASEFKNTPLFNQFVGTPVVKVGAEMHLFLKNIAEKMLLEFESDHALRSEALKGLFKIFIVYLSRGFENDQLANTVSRGMELVNIFYLQVDKYFITKKMVRDYAEMLSVTPSYLNDIVKEVSGFTASHYIRQRIVLEAKRRAIYEGDSMKEIAYYLGFFDPAHFSKYFKNCSGINFTDFRKGVFNFS